ncbi:MAG: hypothetical protein AB1571_03075 [Nanoarchaeota archaeon]
MNTNDIFENVVLCSKCNVKTKKISIDRDGFKIRTLECPNCGKRIYHPLDLQEYENFNKLKNREFTVKLRMVGNSYAVSIPREIIDFQEEMEREIQKEFEKMNKIVKMCLEQPGKLSLFFKKDEFIPLNRKEKKRAEAT